MWAHISRPETTPRLLGGVEALTAAAILVGAWTQAAALVGACVIALWFAFPTTRTVALGTTALAFIMCLSLIVTGAGALAIDWQL